MLALWISGSALAGPLLLPDPDDMGKLRCKDHPVELDNNVEISGDWSVGDAPPGEPTYPTGLASSLVPHATDTELKKASKGKGNVALPAVTSLANEGMPVFLACSPQSATSQDYFTDGCKKPVSCDLVIRHGGRLLQLEQRDEVGATLADPTIDTAKEALGLVALLDRSLFLPMTPAERAAWTEEAAGYRAVTPASEWVQIVERDEGFIVRAPRRASCGCEQDIVRRSWWVSRDGRSCQIEEQPMPLAKAVDVECD